MRSADLTYTGKFVARLLSYGMDTSIRMCRSLDRPKRRAIREAIQADGAYSEAPFGE